MQDDTNHYITRDRINNASFRQKLDPIAENVLRRQNPLELFFRDISTFDVEIPLLAHCCDSLMWGKKTRQATLSKKPHNRQVLTLSYKID